MFKLISAAVMGMFVSTFLFKIVLIDGPAMNPTLESGDRIIVSVQPFEPKPGDIILFEPAYEGAMWYIKRVIAVEGQTVDINFEINEVYVNGVMLDEPYILEPTRHRGDVEFPVTVPEDCVFVLGDNRNDSDDSRRQKVGMVHKDSIIGKMIKKVGE